MTASMGRRRRSARRRQRGGNGQLIVAAGILGLLAVVAVLPGVFTSADPLKCSLDQSLDRPSRTHPFGFDLQGCDYLAKTVYGARTSMGIAVLVITGTAVIALVIGSAAGFIGGRTDALLSRVADVWSGIPPILAGIIILSGSDSRGPLQVALVLILFGWPPMVRVLRASVGEVRHRDYVTAARALGARPSRVLLRHVLPNSVRPLIVLASANAGVIIAAEATLTFAGVGLALPSQSWGVQLFQAQDHLGAAPHLLIFPAIFVISGVTGFVLLGDALGRRANVNPR